MVIVDMQTLKDHASHAFEPSKAAQDLSFSVTHYAGKVVLWLCCGCIVVVVVNVVVLWLCGCVLHVSWLCRGCVVVALWLHCGCECLVVVVVVVIVIVVVV